MKRDLAYPEFADPMVRPRYTGIPTFMRAPYREDLAGIDIGLVGVPFDGGVTNRTGARHGPREIRNQSSLMRRVNQATRIDPYALCRIADLGDAWVEKPFELEGAHCDTGDDYLGSKFHHGAPFRRAVEEGLLDPKRTIQIGIRGGVNDIDVWRFSHDSGTRVVYMEEFYDKGPKAIIAEARAIVGDGPTYVSFDVDGLDPVYAPGTGTPECGGLTVLEAQMMVRRLQGLNLIGGDVVEVAPPFDPTGNTALVGATMMYEILCVVASSVAARRAA